VRYDSSNLFVCQLALGFFLLQIDAPLDAYVCAWVIRPYAWVCACSCDPRRYFF